MTTEEMAEVADEITKMLLKRTEGPADALETISMVMSLIAVACADRPGRALEIVDYYAERMRGDVRRKSQWWQEETLQ